jgi:uncharacterized membrane protein YfcA
MAGKSASRGRHIARGIVLCVVLAVCVQAKMFGAKEGDQRPLGDFTQGGKLAGGSSGAHGSDPPAPGTLPLSAEIERLFKLFKRHVMSESEFTSAKAAVIAGVGGGHGFSPSPDALARTPAFARVPRISGSRTTRVHTGRARHHKDLLPLSSRDYLSLSLAIIGLMIAAGGGIGGGGILVPLYIMVMGFSPKFGIALSNITIFGGAIVNTVLNSSKRHPDADRPLVDWDLILVMEPPTIAGALIGSFVNKLMPELVLSVMLVLLLTFTARKTLYKGIKTYNKETADFERIERAASAGAAVSAKGAGGADVPVTAAEWGSANAGHSGEEARALKAILDEERTTSSAKVGTLIICFIGVLAANLGKGGGAFPSPLGLKCGSAGFWGVTFFAIAWCVLCTAYVRRKLVRKFHEKARINFTYAPGDIRWDEANTLKYPFICSFAGLFAGMFGIGGGIVKGPLMLEMGVHPQVASATSACMILYTAFTATISFRVFGLIKYDYATFLFCVGMVSTYIGQIAINKALKASGRPSYIVFSIGGVVALSAFFMGMQSIRSLTTSPNIWATSGACSSGA